MQPVAVSAKSPFDAAGWPCSVPARRTRRCWLLRCRLTPLCYCCGPRVCPRAVTRGKCQPGVPCCRFANDPGIVRQPALGRLSPVLGPVVPCSAPGICPGQTARQTKPRQRHRCLPLQTRCLSSILAGQNRGKEDGRRWPVGGGGRSQQLAQIQGQLSPANMQDDGAATVQTIVNPARLDP